MNELRIDVADLLTHPAARRPVHVAARLDGLGSGAAQFGEPLDVDLVLERIPDGVVARGTIRARFDAECGTCLRPVHGDLEVVVSELFEPDPVDGETYPLEGHIIDLEQLVRDSVLLEVPLAPVCAPGDPGCVATADPHGADDDDESTPAGDPRWAALSTLEL